MVADSQRSAMARHPLTRSSLSHRLLKSFLAASFPFPNLRRASGQVLATLVRCICCRKGDVFLFFVATHAMVSLLHRSVAKRPRDVIMWIRCSYFL